MTNKAEGETHQTGMTAGQRVAVIVHVFYLDIWPEVAISIKNLVAAAGGGAVVFATYPAGRCDIAEAIATVFPKAVVRPVSNIGWDVWPFFSVLNDLELSDWDLIVKLHTKRNVDSMWINFRRFLKPDGWRKALLSFCDSVNVARRSLLAFAAQPKLGMIAGERVIDAYGYGMGRSIKDCEKILESIGLSSRKGAVVWGTMWMVRAHLLKPFWRRWTESDFPVPATCNPHAGYGLAGDCEVLFGLLVCAQGYFVSSGRLPQGLAVAHYWMKLCAFRILRGVCQFLRRFIPADSGYINNDTLR